MILHSVPGHTTHLERVEPQRWRLDCSTCARRWHGATWVAAREAHVAATTRRKKDA